MTKKPPFYDVINCDVTNMKFENLNRTSFPNLCAFVQNITMSGYILKEEKLLKVGTFYRPK